MAKLVFLNRVFGPDSEATGLLLSQLVEDLAFENEVTVICARPKSPGCRRWPLLQRENHGTVKIVRTFALNISKRHAYLRYLDFLVYFVFASIAVFRETAEIIVTETDPPVLGLLGGITSLIKGCRFVYYCQDVYPEVAEATGGLKNRMLLALLRFANQLALRRADTVIALAADMAGLLRRKGLPAARIRIVPNWIDCAKIMPQPPLPTLRQKYRDKFLVLYAGNLGWTQNLDTVLEAARLLRHEARVQFALVGDGARRIHLRREAKLMELNNVEFVDHVDPGAMGPVLAAGDLHLIPLGAGVAGCMVPSKVYGILAAGKPFVAMMEKYAEVARMARDSEVGFVVPPNDSAALARTIIESMENRTLLAEMGVRARALAERSYDRIAMTRRFADCLHEVLSGRPTRSEDLEDPAEKIGELSRIPAD